MSCSQCGQDKPIVNKKRELCDDCNYMRLHNGQTKAEVYSEKAQQKEPKQYQFKQKATPFKKPKAIKQQTAKEKTRKEELSQVKMKIEEDAIQNDLYYCWGCGRGGVPLDKSHILSVKHRKDLELEEENINLFHRQCHMDWESGDLVKMLKLITFEKDLMYIKSKDKKTYNKIFGSIEYMLTHEDLLEVAEASVLKARYIYNENDYLI